MLAEAARRELRTTSAIPAPLVPAKVWGDGISQAESSAELSATGERPEFRVAYGRTLPALLKSPQSGKALPG